MLRGRVSPHRKVPAHRVASYKSDGEYIAIKKERNAMHLLLSSPVFASAIIIGGGSVGLLLVIVIVVLLLR
jgi:hypothetical protein